MFFDDEEENEEKKPSQDMLDHQNFLDDLRKVTETPAGKRVFWKLLEHTGVHISVFNRNIQEMCRDEGRREVGLWIEEQLEQVDPELIYEIAKEKVNVRIDR